MKETQIHVKGGNLPLRKTKMSSDSGVWRDPLGWIAAGCLKKDCFDECMVERRSIENWPCSRAVNARLTAMELHFQAE